MKTRFLIFLAAMLLGSASAFAQSGNNEPMKGDVNGDGKVDVADITAVIKIMKDGGGTSEETKYYWYAGQTQPSSMTSNPTVDDTNFTNNKWHTLNGNQISQTIKGGTAGNSWYVAVPTSKEFKFYDSTLTEIDETAIKLSAISINNVSYDVWKSNSTGAKTNVYMTVTPVPQQTYYWYLGYDQDLYDNTESSKTKMLTLTSNNVPTQYTQSSGNKYQIPGTTPNHLIMVIPTTWTVPVIGNPAGGTIGLIKEKSSVSITGISGITFDVYSTDIATIKEVYIN